MRLILTLAALAPLAACSSASLNRLRAAPPPTMSHPFDPVSLRVHPLTHVDDTGPKIGPDQCLLVLHFELKDRYGDLVKGVGALKVELYKPGAGITPGIETQTLSWAPGEMSDPERSSERFDTATRTYRLPLAAPRWVYEWLHMQGSGVRDGAPPWLKLRVTLTVPDAEGVPRLLSDEFVIQG